ncbi:hypothetical protein OG689_02280 [Kitasatospora sp. NBC_00240]|uniref:hypothetical protein n=1 Tax=Kitasatospora sp. NBC_00240 TaxID=2903567 RepID=UPI0022590015|nr:hypothetical protein [Kitasatospora sp. NBC_00240]MCX5208146.1 hypothetical protein [Kitasatospora sp. NBC_00240]
MTTVCQGSDLPREFHRANNEIGERTHLSPRTVGSGCYRVFPDLGVTSRAALRDAPAAVPSDPGRGDAA